MCRVAGILVSFWICVKCTMLIGRHPAINAVQSNFYAPESRMTSNPNEMQEGICSHWILRVALCKLRWVQFVCDPCWQSNHMTIVIKMELCQHIEGWSMGTNPIWPRNTPMKFSGNTPIPILTNQVWYLIHWISKNVFHVVFDGI